MLFPLAAGRMEKVMNMAHTHKMTRLNMYRSAERYKFISLRGLILIPPAGATLRRQGHEIRIYYIQKAKRINRRTGEEPWNFLPKSLAGSLAECSRRYHDTFVARHIRRDQFIFECGIHCTCY